MSYVLELQNLSADLDVTAEFPPSALSWAFCGTISTLSNICVTQFA